MADIAYKGDIMGYDVMSNSALSGSSVSLDDRKSWATNASYTSMFSENILESLMAEVVTPKLLRHESVAGMPTKQKTIVKASAHTAGDLEEGVEITNTVLTADKVTMGIKEVGIMATITDILEKSDLASASAARSTQMGKAMANKMDVDICDDFTAATKELGTANSAITMSKLLDGINYLEAGNAHNLGKLCMVLHPNQTDDFRRELVTGGNANNALNIMRMMGNQTGMFGKVMNGYFGNWYGIDIFQTTNIKTDGSTPNINHHGVFLVANYAMGMLTKDLMMFETIYWPPIRGYAMIAVNWYDQTIIEQRAIAEVTSEAPG